MRKVQKEAEDIYDRAKSEMSWQKSDDAYYAASLLIAAHKNDFPLSPSDISIAADLDVNDIHHAKRRIGRVLGINTMPASPKGYITRFCNELDLPDIVRETALEIYESSSDKSSGRAPSSLAAAAVYSASISTGNRVTQGDLSDVANVSEVTIRSLYSRMMDDAGLGKKPASP